MVQNSVTARDTVSAELIGELDHYSAEGIRAQLDALIADPRVKRLVLDLSNLSFMDSSGIGVMLGRYRTLSRRGGTMAVRGELVPAIERIFQMSGLYQIIERCR